MTLRLSLVCLLFAAAATTFGCDSDDDDDDGDAGSTTTPFGDAGPRLHDKLDGGGMSAAPKPMGKPSGDPARAVTGLEITSPLAHASVTGVLKVTGTAEGHVAAVYVSVGGGPQLLAKGTARWSLRFDTAMLAYGPITIVAYAVGEDGAELQRWIQVYNTDALIGTWYRTRVSQGRNSYCVYTLKGNGEFVPECEGSYLQSYSNWQRDHDDVVAFRRADGAGSDVLATLSHGGERLVLDLNNYYGRSIETLERVHGDTPPPPDEIDAGYTPPDDVDGGYMPPPDDVDGGL